MFHMPMSSPMMTTMLGFCGAVCGLGWGWGTCARAGDKAPKAAAQVPPSSKARRVAALLRFASPKQS